MRKQNFITPYHVNKCIYGIRIYEIRGLFTYSGGIVVSRIFVFRISNIYAYS